MQICPLVSLNGVRMTEEYSYLTLCYLMSVPVNKSAQLHLRVLERKDEVQGVLGL